MPILIQDDFNASDGTNVNGRTPSPTNTPGNNWAVFVSSGTGATIFSNRCYGIGVPAIVFPWIESGVSDCVVSAVLRMFDTTSGNQMAVAFRSSRTTDRQDCWIAVLVNSTQKFELYRVVGGGFTLADSIDFSFTNETDYTCVVTLSGNDISATITGGSRALVTNDSTYATNTIHGLGLVGTNVASGDDFIVDTGGGVVAPKRLAILGVG